MTKIGPERHRTFLVQPPQCAILPEFFRERRHKISVWINEKTTKPFDFRSVGEGSGQSHETVTSRP